MSGLRYLCTRRNLLTLCIGVGSAALAVGADVTFSKVRANIATEVADFRGVACMESVERIRYAPRKPIANATCAQWIAATADTPRGTLEWRSRLRLDVTAGADGEEFALTEASAFEKTDIGGILSTAVAGNGEFGTFLRRLVADNPDQFEARGLEQTPIGKLLAFGFTEPVSHPGPVSYHGSLWAIPDSGDLKRLTVQTENAGDACRVQYTTDYASTRVGDREIILPQSSTMEAISANGVELRSQTYYSGCRRPVAPVIAAATGSAKPIPPNIRLHVRFEPPIDSGTAASGDPVVGVIRTTVKDKQNGIIVHAGDRLHGRIASIEEYLSPQRRWDVAIAFETIERGVGEHGIDRGVEQLVSLASIDDGDRSAHGGSSGGAAPQTQRQPNVGHFIFEDAGILLDQKFETIWETR